jgi:hypothetical protein
LVAGAVALSLPITLSPQIERRLMEAVSERFQSDVDVESLEVSVLPRARIRGQGLVLRQRNRSGGPALVTIHAFSAEASLFGVFRTPLRLARVELDGLEINVPPGGLNLPDEDPKPAGASRDDPPDSPPGPSPLVVEHLVSERALLTLLRGTPGKAPRVFDIRQLTMQDVGADHPWPFRAELTNPTPPGDIHTAGTFGPWNAHRPEATPLSAEYRFEQADLSVFEGIQGRLDSTGRFGGVLERIDVHGQVRVPDFALSDVGQPVPLTATFHSIVDGTSGDTLLEPVDARLVDSPILASGGVVERDGEDGRTVDLDITMAGARVEDVLRLSVKGTRPGMTGRLTVRTRLVLPPGKTDVIRRMRLDGTFAVEEARFTAQTVQAKVDEFSTKARGVRDDTPPPVVSNFRGRFAMRSGVLTFSDVAFSMPGARVNVAGQYAMPTEALDFRGTVRLDARLSALTTGFKSLLVRLIDGLFRHEDMTVVPITISGTADAPKVKLDLKRVFSRN